jgi:prephenate dehydrogenase
MDVGSTKRDVVDSARRALREHIGSFVPAHPIAGKEVAGVENADAELYTGKQVIITPIDRTLAPQIQRATDVWTALGCKVQRMTPEAHDAAFAAISHLPHLIAFALMNAIGGQANSKDFLALAGPGFRDFSRIAASDPLIWRDIMVSNREELLTQAKIFHRNMQAMEMLISSGDGEALERLIGQASQARANWSMNKNRR